MVIKLFGYLYDGTNGADIVETVNAPSLTYVAPDLLFDWGFGTLTVEPNTYITPGPSPSLIPADNVNLYPPPASTYPPQSAIGVASIPSITADNNATVDVTIKPTLPSTSYTPGAVISGSVTLLGQLSLTSAAVLDESTVRCVVHNGALITVSGGTLIVTAVMN